MTSIVAAPRYSRLVIAMPLTQTITPPSASSASEVQLEIRMENISIGANCIRHRRVADRGVIQMQPFCIDSKSALFDRIKIGTDTEFTRVAPHSVNSRAAAVNLPKVFDRHGGGLNLKSVIVEIWNSSDVETLIIIEPSPVVFGFQ